MQDDQPELLGRLNLEPNRYHLVVARFEPENNVDLIVDGYRRSTAAYPLVVVGSAVELALVALGAGYLPARRASKIHPMQALRYE